MYILPFRGEFGIKLLRHVPRVHALNHANKIVCCEEGEQALYPSAAAFMMVGRNVDSRRRDDPYHDYPFVKDFVISSILPRFKPGDSLVWPGFESAATGYFRPKPFVNSPETGDMEVVICPRRRDYGSSKNWPFWPDLVTKLSQNGVAKVAAVGAPDSSDGRLETMIPCAWKSPRPLDSTISWMLRSKLIIATDNGLAHLAVWCGKPLLLISHANGVVAPGLVVDETGYGNNHYGPIALSDYQSENHLASPVILHRSSWDDPNGIARKAALFLSGDEESIKEGRLSM